MSVNLTEYKRAVGRLKVKVDLLDESTPFTEVAEKFLINKTAELLLIVAGIFAVDYKWVSIVLTIAAKLIKVKENTSS